MRLRDNIPCTRVVESTCGSPLCRTVESTPIDLYACSSRTAHRPPNTGETCNLVEGDACRGGAWTPLASKAKGVLRSIRFSGGRLIDRRGS
jgi:hypothetical protein